MTTRKKSSGNVTYSYGFTEIHKSKQNIYLAIASAVIIGLSFIYLIYC